MDKQLSVADQTLIHDELDEDLRGLVWRSPSLALQVQQVRELKRLREDVQAATTSAWLDGGEGRSG